MLRKWVLLLTSAAGAIACLAAVAWVAGDAREAKAAADEQAKSPLQKIMVKMDEQTKAIQKVSSSLARFKKAGSGQDLVPAAEQLAKLGEDTRKFTEPAEAVKKPQQKWDEYTDQYILAAGEMAKAAKKKDFQEIRKAFKSLDQACTNCHGLFRPKTGGDEFGALDRLTQAPTTASMVVGALPSSRLLTNRNAGFFQRVVRSTIARIAFLAAWSGSRTS